MPSKLGGTQIEGRVEQQQQRHQAAARLLLADVDSESVQTAIQCLFDASIMLEDSAFRNFVGALCKLSLARWSTCRVALMSVLVLAPGCLGCGGGRYSKCEYECYEPRPSRTERVSKRRVSGIHIPQTLVRYVHLPLSTPIEIRTAVRRLCCSPGGRVLNI